MSRKNQSKQVEDVVEVKEEKPVVAEETEAPKVEESSEKETTETPEEKEPEKEIKEEKIDPRISAIISLHRKEKVSEKEKQTKIYSAMDNIKIVRSK